jgi:PAS domain S-box-containing protein
LIAGRLSRINEGVNISSDARLRIDTVRELEIHTARYTLAVRERLQDGRARSEAPAGEANRLDAAVAEYTRIVRTDAQRDLASRLNAAWRELRDRTGPLFAAGASPPPPAALAAFEAAHQSLKSLLGAEIRPAALTSFEARRSAVRAELRNVFGFTLIVLLSGAILAVITSIVVSRGILRDGRTIAEQGERLRTTLASIGDGVIATDAAGRITKMNAVAESLTGWTDDEAAGRPLSDVFHILNEQSRLPVENPAEQALREGETVRLANHTILIAKDGTERAIDDSAAPIRCKVGEIVGAVLVFRDVTERRRIASGIRRSERELSEFFDNASVPIHWLGPDGKIIRANPSELRMLGYEEEQFVGRPVSDFYGETAVINEMLVRLADAETVREQPAWVCCKDGSVRDVLIDASAFFEDGKLVRSSWFTRDVTVLKRAQQAQARLAAIVRSSDDAIVGKNLDGIVQSWNDSAERIFGYTAGEAVGRHISFLIPADRLYEEDEILTKIRAGEAIDHFESVRVRKDGRRVQVSLTISPIRDDSGRIIGASKIARDITSRKYAEQQLRESEERFRTLADSAPMLIWMTGADKRATWFNKVWLDFVGPGSEEEPGDWAANIHTDDLGSSLAGYSEFFDRREPFVMEFRLRRNDGNHRWMICRGVTRFAPDGTFLGYLASCADIHDRVLAEEALRRKSSALETIHRVNLSLVGDLKLDSLIQSVTDSATAVTRAQFGAFFFNVFDARGESYMLYSLSGAPREAFERFGLPRKTAVFAPTFEGRGVLRSDDVTKDPRYGKMAPHHGLPEGHLPVRSYLAVPVVSRSGEVHGGLFFGHPEAGVFDEQDEQIVVGIAAQAAVAIDNARLYEQLRASEERFRVLSETIPAIIWACRPDGSIFYLNRAWLELTGQSADESFGSGWTEMVHPEDRPRVLEQWRRSMQTGEILEGEVRYLRHDGRYRWHFFRGTPVRNEEGAISAWHGASLDIQEQKSAEEALRDADRRKDEFLATLSHELRNPLAPISMGLEVLKTFAGDAAKVEETRSMMERQTRQLVRLVDDLLDVSRITRGKLELRRTTVRLRDVIASAIEASQVFIDRAGHTLEVSLPEQPVWINADPNRLAQVISNLVINAAKYTPDGGRIELSVKREGDSRVVVLSVADNGVGIPPEMLDRIFEMFTQVVDSSKPSSSGLGIGLTLVQSLVQMHGGTVEASSGGLNQGSEFRVRLPIVAPPPKLTEATAPAKPAVKVRHRVLVVDDNKTAAEMLGMVVEMLGHEVRTANDGGEALEVGARYLPHLILMDLGMPNLDGYEAAREVRKREWGKSTLLVALTGWDQEQHRNRTREAGFDYHLVKPGEIADLQTLFQELERRNS